MSAILALDLAAGRPNPNARKRWAGGSRVAEIACDGCGKRYVDYVSRIAKASRHFCSAACHRASRAGAMNPKWRGGMARRSCEQCGHRFEIFAASVTYGEGRFCSHRCKGVAQTKYPTKVIAHREHGRRREARVRAGRAIATHTYAQWQALLARHGHKCADCGAGGKLTRDHIMPLSKGGDDGIANIQPLCHSCNARKGNR